MISPLHIRMARAALGLTLKELGDRAGVNMNTIARYEAGHEILTGTMKRIEEVLRSEGVVFIEEDDEFHASIRIRKTVAGIEIEVGPPSQMRHPRSRQKKRK